MMGASRFVFGTLVLSLFAVQLAAQQDAAPNNARPTAKVLDPGDLAGWKSIRMTTWSLDGRIFAYQLAPNEGDAEVVIKTVADGKETRYPIGEAPRGVGGPPGGGCGNRRRTGSLGRRQMGRVSQVSVVQGCEADAQGPSADPVVGDDR